MGRLSSSLLLLIMMMVIVVVAVVAVVVVVVVAVAVAVAVAVVVVVVGHRHRRRHRPCWPYCFIYPRHKDLEAVACLVDAIKDDRCRHANTSSQKTPLGEETRWGIYTLNKKKGW